MLLKWLLTLLSILWLIQALRPYFIGQPSHASPKTRVHPPKPDPQYRPDTPRFKEDDGEYLDYEEIK
ncbi:MAG: hypothetical protein KGS48_09000 [Bacteroidetes bacterium]|nr:hypothetical protein [Bacteroidota bacterium]